MKKHTLGEEILETVRAILAVRGLTMRQGIVVDATLIYPPGSTKNRERNRDPVMHKNNKGNQ